MITYILFIIGFVLLVKGADFLVEGASALARRLGISDLVVGLTIVAFGTSAPELLVNIFAASSGHTDIAIANVVGSNIANILLILGIAALISPLDVKQDTVWREIPICFFAAVVLTVLANDFFLKGVEPGTLDMSEGMILLLLFSLFIYYMLVTVRKEKPKDTKKQNGNSGLGQMEMKRAVVLVIMGLVGVNMGAKFVVDGAVEIAKTLGVSQGMIGLTIVALGTSLPELVTSAMAALKKNADIAVGNVVGSNIFNIFLILGLSASIRPLPFSSHMNIDLGVMMVASALLFLFMFTGRKRNLLERAEGVIFLILYGAYLIFTIARG